VKQVKTNLKQKNFYENKNKNLATRIWSKIRNGLLANSRKVMGFERQIIDLHLLWIGDLSNKKVLDLGCYEGNSLSYYLAKNAKIYVAIDLSEKGISHLKKRIKFFPNAQAYPIDFLSDDFKDSGFDLIYAYGVLHHFKNTSELINKLNQKLAPKGEIINYDPLETNLPIKILRTIYRPFQSDRAWEWPFTRKTFYAYESAFIIKEKRGMLGKSKWFSLINILPFSKDKKNKIGRKWHKSDWEKSQKSNYHLFKCMHLTMLMQKKT